MIIMDTNVGVIKLELDFENTPNTAQNFLDYVNEGFYNDTIFHRVISGFMIQGGGFDRDMVQKKSKQKIQNEADKSKANKRGTIAMARTSDPHSASNQFFINVADNTFLNFKSQTQEGWGYCVFGQVIEGMDIVDKIQQVATTQRAGHGDVPKNDVVIEKMWSE